MSKLWLKAVISEALVEAVMVRERAPLVGARVEAMPASPASPSSLGRTETQRGQS